VDIRHTVPAVATEGTDTNKNEQLGAWILRKTVIFAAALTLGALTALVASSAVTRADSSPENVVKYRQLLMKANGAHISAIGAILKGEVDYGAKHIEEHAEAINGMAQILADAFRANVGTSGGETRATQEIWSGWDDFVAKAKNLQDVSASLGELAEGGGDMAAIGDGVKALGGACGACHNEFRVKN
jgi:cytochrome c556